MHAGRSGGWGLSSRLRGDGRDSAVWTTRPQPPSQRRRPDWVRSSPPYPSAVTGLAPLNRVRSARRVRFAWRARWLGKSPLTGRAPLSCNHEGWSACRHAASGFVRRGGAGAPTACLASGSGLTLIRIAKTPGGTSAQVYHRAGDVRCPRIHRIRQGRTGLLEMHNDRLETRCFQKPSILIDRAPGGVILFIRTPRSLEPYDASVEVLRHGGFPWTMSRPQHRQENRCRPPTGDRTSRAFRP